MLPTRGCYSASKLDIVSPLELDLGGRPCRLAQLEAKQQKDYSIIYCFRTESDPLVSREGMMVFDGPVHLSETCLFPSIANDDRLLIWMGRFVQHWRLTWKGRRPLVWRIIFLCIVSCLAYE